MTTTLKTVGPTLLTATDDTTLYTVPSGAAGTGFIIRTIIVASAADIDDVWFTLSLGTDAIGTRIAYKRPIVNRYEYMAGLFLHVEQAIVIKGRASVVNAASVTLSGTLET